MTTVRKWRFPVLIGGGIVAAGVLFYFGNGHINSRATQGTIAHRDVYRDGEVKPGDVGTPGAAPVAVKAVLESKDFQKLAKNQAFQGILSDKSFQAMAQKGAFWDLVKTKAFTSMMQSSEFKQAMQNPAFIGQLQNGTALRSQAEMSRQLSAMNVQGLVGNASFNALVNNSAFIGLLNKSAFTNLLASNNFGLLMANASFLNLASSAEFRNAMEAGSAANLSTQLQMLNSGLSSKLARE